MQRRGISEVVTTLLFVLIALGAVLLVWNLVRGIITQSSEDIDVTQFNLKYELPGKSVYVNAPQEKVSFLVKRDAGSGETYGFNVILEDESGQSKNFPSDVVVSELESKIINIDYSGSELGKIAKVSIAPILKTASGKEKIGNILAEVSVGEEMVGSALSFDGSNNGKASVNIGKTILDTSENWAFSFWFNQRIVNQATFPISLPKDDSSGWATPTMSLYLTGDNRAFIKTLSANSIVLSGINSITTFNVDTWYHIVGQTDGSNLLLFVNGIQETKTPYDSGVGLYEGTGSFGIDYLRGGATTKFNGLMDDIRIYDRALTSEEISDLYAGDYFGAVAEDNLVGWWKFDDKDTTDVAKDSSGNGNDGTIVGATYV